MARLLRVDSGSKAVAAATCGCDSCERDGLPDDDDDDGGSCGVLEKQNERSLWLACPVRGHVIKECRERET